MDDGENLVFLDGTALAQAPFRSRPRGEESV
jgi:hypothetical protein